MREYAAPLKDAGVDTVILGCTHYPLIRPIFQRVFGRDVTLVFSAEETAREVDGDARAQGHRERRRRATARIAFSRREIRSLREMGRRFLQLPIGEVEHVTLAQLEVLLHDARGRTPSRRSCAPLTIEPDYLENPHGSALITQGQDEGALHGDGAGGGAALAAQQGPRLDDRGVLAAAGVDRRPRRARGVARQAAGAHDRDPAADRARAARRRRLPARSASGRSGSTATCCRPTAARAARRSAARTSPAQRALDRFGLSRAFVDSVAAVSVGVVDGVPLLDLDYSEDSNADTDMNVVMTGDGRLIEVQATAERDPFTRATLDELLALAEAGIARDRRDPGGGGRSCTSLAPRSRRSTWPHVLLRLSVAAVLGGAIGMERELRERQAGPAHASRRLRRLGALHARLGLRLPRVPRQRRLARPHRSDADRGADRERHRLPRRGRDHPPGPLRARPDDGRDAVARRGDRHGVGRRLLQRRAHRDRRRAAHARPAAHRRLQDRAPLPPGGRPAARRDPRGRQPRRR